MYLHEKLYYFIEIATSEQGVGGRTTLHKMICIVKMLGFWKLPSLKVFKSIKKNFQNLKQARISTVKIQNWQKKKYFYPQFLTITSLLGPATEEDRESSRSSGSTETFSLDKIVTSPLFLAKKMGRLVQEPAPKMLSPKMVKKQKSM